MAAIGSKYMKQAIDKTFQTVDSSSMETDDDDDVDDIFKATSTFHQMLPRLLKRLDSLVGSNFNKDNVQVVETLSAVCLQSMLGSFIPIKVYQTFERVLKATNHWTQYRIGRSASRYIGSFENFPTIKERFNRTIIIIFTRYGHHFLAATIYENLSSNVSLEKLHFFLSGLSQISKAECTLNYGCEYTQIEEYYNQPSSQDGHGKRLKSTLTLAERLENAVTLYWKALAKFKVKSIFEVS